MASVFSTLGCGGGPKQAQAPLFDCMPGSIMPVSVGVIVGSLFFGPHPITIILGSTSVGSIESKGE